MQVLKRNQVVTVDYKDLGQRVAVVKSYRASDNTANITIALYRENSTFTDWRVDAALLTATPIPFADWQVLAWCFPEVDKVGCPMLAAQRIADAAWPVYAALRKCYGPRETGNQIMARMAREKQAQQKIAA